MTILQLLVLPKRIEKFPTICDFFVVTLIFFQYYNNLVNCSRFQDLNLYNGDYISEILRRYKRQDDISSKCEIPNYGLHAIYTILGETATIYQPGDFAQQFYTLEISCNRGYNLTPFVDKRTVCINGQWNPPLTINCIQTCPSLKSTMSTNIKCKYNNIPLENCKNPIEETTAILSCNPLYEQDDLQKNRIRLCRSGRWSPSISECYPICGIKRPEGRLNIVNGQNATLGDYPWHVGIYNAQKELICGGSIIDRHIILTAAHCVTDYNGNVQPTEDYFIAAGKYYRKYDDNKDRFAQYSKVLYIHVPERYTGLLNNFALDIAIILLADPFTISVEVQPVCIELNDESPYLHFSLNSNGIVTGWGYTKEGRELSEVLKELVIPYIPFRNCFEKVPNKFKRYITFDKICGGYLNNETSVCTGDSRGALVFENILSGRYYVKGIVSTSPSTGELTCDSNQYSLYTSVNQHIDFITNILVYNQMQQSMEFSTEDVTTKDNDKSALEITTRSSKYFTSEMLPQDDLSPPEIIPKGEDYIINATQSFTLRCSGKNFVTWTAPDNDYSSEEPLPKYSNITVKSLYTPDSEYSYESVLTISNASYLDVGYYYCHENTTDFNDSSRVSRIYIYVYDAKILSLNPESVPYAIIVVENSDAVLPCKPTSPDVKVELRYTTGGEIQLNIKDEFGNYVTYDPKKGYTISKVTLDDYSNLYVCIFSRLNDEQRSAILVERITYSIAKPLLEKISDRQTIIGQKLMLKCTLRCNRPFTMDWDVPNKNGIENGQIYISKSTKIENDDVYFQTLEIKNITIADQGEYTCIVRSIFHVNNDSKFIKVYDHMEHFINLTLKSGVQDVWIKAGKSSVQWHIDVKAYPTPKFVWYDNTNNEIQTGLKSSNNSKYVIEIENKKDVFLQINDITIFDWGSYKLKAMNDFEEITINLFLHVTDKPSVDIQMKNFHIIHESIIIKCNVAAYPEPTVKWLYKPCLDRGCNYTHILSDRVVIKGYLTTAFLNITAQHTGYILCTANNSLGSDEVSKGFFLTDVKNGFGIWGLDEDTMEIENKVSQYPVAIGDNLTIYCAASHYYYRSNLKWYKQFNGNRYIILEKNDHYEIENLVLTNYSYKITLSITNLSYDDSGKYFCVAEKKFYGNRVNDTVVIVVRDPKVK